MHTKQLVSILRCIGDYNRKKNPEISETADLLSTYVIPNTIHTHINTIVFNFLTNISKPHKSSSKIIVPTSDKLITFINKHESLSTIKNFLIDVINATQNIHILYSYMISSKSEKQSNLAYHLHNYCYSSLNLKLKLYPKQTLIKLIKTQLLKEFTDAHFIGSIIYDPDKANDINIICSNNTYIKIITLLTSFFNIQVSSIDDNSIITAHDIYATYNNYIKHKETKITTITFIITPLSPITQPTITFDFIEMSQILSRTGIHLAANSHMDFLQAQTNLENKLITQPKINIHSIDDIKSITKQWKRCFHRIMQGYTIINGIQCGELLVWHNKSALVQYLNTIFIPVINKIITEYVNPIDASCECRKPGNIFVNIQSSPDLLPQLFHLECLEILMTKTFNKQGLAALFHLFKSCHN